MSVVQKLIDELFIQVITRYVKMGVGEFLRQFRRDFEIQKTEAHRKKVIEKQKKKDLIASKVTLQSIRNDISVNKRNSHCHLQTMIDQHETVCQTTLYTKSEIQSLCKAYGLVYRKNYSKAKLSAQLIPATRQSTFIPWPLMLSDTQQGTTSTS